VKADAVVTIGGIAWDAGYGISQVVVSTDGGKGWSAGTLGEDAGNFAFRPWTYRFAPKAGKATVMARATNKIGQTQTTALIQNPAGYHHNLVHSITLSVA